MQHTRVSLFVTLAALLGLTPFLAGQETATPARLKVLVPLNAVVEIDGVKTRQTGENRVFASPPLTPGKKYSYVVKATWTDDAGKEASKEETVTVRAGEESLVDLRPAAVKVTPPVKTDMAYTAAPADLVEEMLREAKVTDDDFLLDLASGDGRFLIAAAKSYASKGLGLDSDPKRVEEAKAAVARAGVDKLVEIRQEDLSTMKDLPKANVVVLHPLPEVNKRLKALLQKKLKPGTRIVAHDTDMGDWRPVSKADFTDKDGVKHTHALWIVGADNKGPIDTTGKPVKPDPKRPKLDVPYVPTPQAVVDKMLETAKLTKDDVVFDLGCGDGRIVVSAAKKHGCKAVGVDLDPKRCEESLANVKKAGVGKLVEIREGDALKVEDLDKASVVFLYLLPELNLKLRPILEKHLKAGARIVTHDFDMGDAWKPLKEFEMKAKDDDGEEAVHTIYYYEIDAIRKADREPDVIYVPTPQGTVDKMLELAKVKESDIVYDLGCGDGRIPVTAAKKYKAKAWGFDIDPKRIQESNENVKKAGVEKLVTIDKKDIFTLDLSKVDVLTLYLLPELNVKLLPQIKKMKAGSRVVTHDFDIEGITPDETVEVTVKKDNGQEKTSKIYLFTLPLNAEKK